MQLLIGIILGAAAAWLYSSDRARARAQERLSTVPDTFGQMRQAVASAAAEGAQRVSEAIDSAPLPDPVKGPASAAAFSAWAAADQLGQGAADTEPGSGQDRP